VGQLCKLQRRFYRRSLSRATVRYWEWDCFVKIKVRAQRENRLLE
jgi:hypothetical protein